MNVPQEQLNALRARVESLRAELFAARRASLGGRREAVQERIDAALETVITLGVSLDRAGAERPTGMRPRNETPLALLDTPANRRYAEKLREAWEAGLAVDRERYGPDIGTDGCAQIIEMVLADVEEELYGPAGVRE